MSGQALTSSQGSIATLAVTVALAGASFAATAGITTANNDGNVALTGQVATFAQRAPSPDSIQAITGTAITSSAGSPTISIRGDTFVGITLTSAAGFMSAFGADRTVNLSPQEAAFVLGTVVSGGQSLSGITLTFSTGTLQTTNTPTSTLLGLDINSTPGTIIAGQDAGVDSFVQSALGTPVVNMTLAVAGIDLVSSQGSVAITGDVVQPIVGTDLISSIGAVVVDAQPPLTGLSAAFSQSPFGAPGMAALTGSTITGATGILFTTEDRTQALIGTSMSAIDGLAVTSYLAFVSGAQIDLSQSDLGPREVTLTGASMAAIPGFVIPPAIEVVAGHGGGYLRKHHFMDYARRPTDEDVQRERERLGILPPSIQKAVDKVIAAQVAKPDSYESAVALAEKVTEPRAQVRLKSAIRAEIPDKRATVPADATFIAQTLILDALVKDWENRQRADQAAKDESTEIQELLELWLRS